MNPCGTCPCFKFWNTYKKYSLMYYTCEYNHYNSIQMSIQHGQMNSQRQGDKSLMSVEAELFKKTSELRFIQKVRLLLWLGRVSDVCSSDGRKMDKSFLSLKQDRKCRNDHWLPSRYHVTPADYTPWRNLLKDSSSLISIT